MEHSAPEIETTASQGHPLSRPADTRVVYCGDNLEQIQKLTGASVDYSDDALREIDAFLKRAHKVIVPLTEKEIPDEQIARKLV